MRNAKLARLGYRATLKARTNLTKAQRFLHLAENPHGLIDCRLRPVYLCVVSLQTFSVSDSPAVNVDFGCFGLPAMLQAFNLGIHHEAYR